METPKPPGHNPFAALRAKLGNLPPGPAPVQQPAEPVAEAKTKARCVVRRERSGRGGKAVTLIEGPGLDGQDLENLARQVKKALGTGAHVEGSAIAVQGDQPDRVVEWLRKQGWQDIVRAN